MPLHRFAGFLAGFGSNALTGQSIVVSQGWFIAVAHTRPLRAQIKREPKVRRRKARMLIIEKLPRLIASPAAKAGA